MNLLLAFMIGVLVGGMIVVDKTPDDEINIEE